METPDTCSNETSSNYEVAVKAKKQQQQERKNRQSDIGSVARVQAP